MHRCNNNDCRIDQKLSKDGSKRGFWNRDVSASYKMITCGISMIEGTQRPEAFRRPKKLSGGRVLRQGNDPQ